MIKEMFQRFLARKTSAVAALIGGATNGPVWSEDRYDVYAKETYLKNVIAYRCIEERAGAVAAIPWLLYQRARAGGEDVEIEQHPLLDLVTWANPYDSFAYLMAKASSYDSIAGNIFVERVVVGEWPMELYIHRPDRITIVPNKDGTLAEYVYKINGAERKFPVDRVTQQGDLMHIRRFHPTDDFWGASGTKAAAYEVDSSNEATAWNKSLLQNQGRPGMLFQYDGTLSPEQFTQLEQMLRDKHTGGGNAGKNLILENAKDIKVTPYGWSPAELDFIEGGRELARRICLAYKVPPMLIGIPGDNTYSNYREARAAFYEDTIIPDVRFYIAAFNNWFFRYKDNGMYFAPDLEEVPAIVEKRERTWKMADASEDLTINERRAMKGYGPIDGGDVVLIPASMLPLGEELPDETGKKPTAEEDMEDEEDTTE